MLQAAFPLHLIGMNKLHGQVSRFGAAHRRILQAISP
jgi:hypothetical protein